RTSDPQIRSLVLYPAELRAPVASRARKMIRARLRPPGAAHSYRLGAALAREPVLPIGANLKNDGCSPLEPKRFLRGAMRDGPAIWRESRITVLSAKARYG